MKINAIGADYSALRVEKNRGVRVKNADPIPNGMSVISFRGGNPKHLFHQISEINMLGFGSGGVATVGNDLFFNHEGFDKIIENIPLYNQDVKYVPDINPNTKEIVGIKQDGVTLRRIPTNLPSDHPFKSYEGSVFATNEAIGKDVDLADFLKQDEHAKKAFILDEVKTSKISWGLENDVPVGIYKVKKDEKMKNLMRKNRWTDDMINKIDITFTYVDATASMAKPYADGSYSTATGDSLAKSLSVGWQGLPYPKEAKATAELLPYLKEKMGFDPKYIMCHDGQAMPLVHYVAELNASGNPYWQDKVVTSIGHNLCDGYMYSLGTKDAVVALAKPGEIKKIIDSKEYTEALKLGKEDAFLKSLLPKEILDARGQTNAVMFSIAYGDKGFLPRFTTVSNKYFKSIAENELVSPALYKRLKELGEKNIFDGIINVLMDPNASGFTTDGLQEYYQKDCKIKLKDGKEVTLPKFLAFDENKKYDLKHIREIKRQNKISLLKRLNNDFIGSQLFSEKDKKWLDAGSGFSAAVTGGTGRNFKILGGIDKKYLDMLEKGQDVAMFTSWGRGDFQKGMDTGLEAFVKYVKKTGDKNSIYVFGGDMKNLKEVTELVTDLNKDEMFRGRILLLDGWTPGSSFAAAADYANLASRFAPCELTDLEAMKKGCIPIVPKVQGMDQKVFDPTDSEHAKYINGYKGKHEYYMPEADALKIASKDEQAAFNKVKEDVSKKLKKDYKSKIGADIPESLFERQLHGHEDYKKALQKLRDSIISDEIAECMERAMKDRNTDIAEKLWKNHVDLKTTWKENGWMNPDGSSTQKLYEELHFKVKGKNLLKDEALKLDLSKLNLESGTGTSTGTEVSTNTFKSIKQWFKAHKKASIIAGSAVGVAALGFAGYKAGWFSPKFEEKKKNGNLSCVG